MVHAAVNGARSAAAAGILVRWNASVSGDISAVPALRLLHLRLPSACLQYTQIQQQLLFSVPLARVAGEGSVRSFYRESTTPCFGGILRRLVSPPPGKRTHDNSPVLKSVCGPGNFHSNAAWQHCSVRNQPVCGVLPPLNHLPCSSRISTSENSDRLDRVGGGAAAYTWYSTLRGVAEFPRESARRHCLELLWNTGVACRKEICTQQGSEPDKAGAGESCPSAGRRRQERQAKGETDEMEENFERALQSAKKITVLTGAGVSAESGVPTFRGSGGLWRLYDAAELAHPAAFAAQPSLVWEFYHYRRGMVMRAAPNSAHYAIASLEQKCKEEGKEFTLLTQNIDGLHYVAGSKNVVEIHGSLWETRCTCCEDIQENRDMPICPALEGKGSPEIGAANAVLPATLLPRCAKSGCNALLRPNVIWFTEPLDPMVLTKAFESITSCDLMLVIGTSALVHPAASYPLLVLGRGGAVAEFNVEETSLTKRSSFFFGGKCGTTLPRMLASFLATEKSNAP